MGFFSKVWDWAKRSRKAIAGFFTPFLGLPVAEWIAGDQPFDIGLVKIAVVSAVTGVLTYWVTNDDPTTKPEDESSF